MKFRLNLRLKIFLLSAVVIVGAQLPYSKINSDSFQASYLSTLRLKYERLGGFLERELEQVLNVWPHLDRLRNLEHRIHEILMATPQRDPSLRELEFIEITDARGELLYFADHTSIAHLRNTDARSKTLDPGSIQTLNDHGLSPADTDIRLSLEVGQADGNAPKFAGFITMRLSPELVAARSRQILLDMITVALVSLLVTFELLNFFLTRAMSGALGRGVARLKASIAILTPVSSQRPPLIAEMQPVATRFNAFLAEMQGLVGTLRTLRESLLPTAQAIGDEVSARQGRIDGLVAKQKKNLPPAQAAKIAGLQSELQAKAGRLNAALGRLTEDRPADPGAQPVATAITEFEGTTRAAANPSYIRPLVFMFLIGTGLNTAFFPLFVEGFGAAIPGLSREITIALPISCYMLFMAISLPLAGSWSDTVGWRRTLLLGVLLNAVSLALMAYAQDITQVLVLRALAGIGYGSAYTGCQRFVIDNSTSKDRASGMSSLLAALFGGNLVGIVMGGILAERIGYGNVFLLSGLFSLAAFAYAIAVFHKQHSQVAEGPADHTRLRLRELLQVFKDRDFLAIVLFQAIPAKMVLVGVVYYLLPLYLHTLGIIEADIGRVIMGYGLAMVFLGPPCARVLDRPSRRKSSILAGGLISALALVSFQFLTGLPAALVLVVLLGIAHTLSSSTQAACISESAAVKALGTGTGMGVFRFWERMGNVVGPLLVAYLAAKLGHVQTVVTLGALLLMGNLLYLLLVGKSRQGDLEIKVAH